MKTIAIISSSVRRGRDSHRVALFFKRYIEDNKLLPESDLKDYNFLSLMNACAICLTRHLSDAVAEKMRSADGVIMYS
jgi:hypothetical protein